MRWSLAAVLAVIALVLAVVYFTGGSNSGTGASGDAPNTQRIEDEVTPLGSESLGRSGSATGEASETSDAALAPSSGKLPAARRLRAVRPESGSIHVSDVQAIAADESDFQELLSQLRDEQRDQRIADTHDSYLGHFQSQPEVAKGSVAIDAFECGAVACVASIRALHEPDLNDFVENVSESDDFPAYAFAQVVDYPSSGEPRLRLVFSHDPALSALTIEYETPVPE